MKHRTRSSGKIIKKEGYTKRILFSPEDFQGRRYLVQTVTVPPKEKALPHFHKKQTEVFYVLKGKAIMFLDGKEILVKPGDTTICSPGEKHYHHNKFDKPFVEIVFKIDFPEKDDTVWIE